MKFISLVTVCIFVTSCSWRPKGVDNAVTVRALKDIALISKQSKPIEWPYRYRLDYRNKVWAGEVDVGADGEFMFFDKFEITGQSATAIQFTALYGGSSKSFPVKWDLSVKEVGGIYKGTLRSLDFDIEPVDLVFQKKLTERTIRAIQPPTKRSS